MKRNRNGSTNTYANMQALADDLGLSLKTTQSAVKHGIIPSVRIGRRVILSRAAVADWLRSSGGFRPVASDLK